MPGATASSSARALAERVRAHAEVGYQIVV